MENKIVFLSINEQAKYADNVCKMLISDGREDHKMIDDLSKEIHVKELYDWNATSVGNLAYIALNSKNQDIVQLCMDLLYIYRMFTENNEKIVRSVNDNVFFDSHIDNISDLSVKLIQSIKTFNKKILELRGKYGKID